MYTRISLFPIQKILVSTPISYLGTPLTLSQTSQHDRNDNFLSTRCEVGVKG